LIRRKKQRGNTQVHKVKSSITINVNTCTDGVSVVVINHDTNKIFEFADFVIVGFTDEGEYIANNCTIPQVAQSLFRLHDLYDELVAEAQLKDKPKLTVLPAKSK
jgi:ABC-type hemin transport system ATPase subunit